MSNKITLLESNTKSGLNMDAINGNSKVLCIVLFKILVKKKINSTNFSLNKILGREKIIKITYI